MLRVTVEYLRHPGDPEPVVVARGHIRTHDQPTPNGHATYAVAFTATDTPETLMGRVHHFPRADMGVWDLVLAALTQALGWRAGGSVRKAARHRRPVL